MLRLPPVVALGTPDIKVHAELGEPGRNRSPEASVGFDKKDKKDRDAARRWAGPLRWRRAKEDSQLPGPGADAVAAQLEGALKVREGGTVRVHMTAPLGLSPVRYSLTSRRAPPSPLLPGAVPHLLLPRGACVQPQSRRQAAEQARGHVVAARPLRHRRGRRRRGAAPGRRRRGRQGRQGGSQGGGAAGQGGGRAGQVGGEDRGAGGGDCGGSSGGAAAAAGHRLHRALQVGLAQPRGKGVQACSSLGTAFDFGPANRAACTRSAAPVMQDASGAGDADAVGDERRHPAVGQLCCDALPRWVFLFWAERRHAAMLMLPASRQWPCRAGWGEQRSVAWPHALLRSSLQPRTTSTGRRCGAPGSKCGCAPCWWCSRSPSSCSSPSAPSPGRSATSTWPCAAARQVGCLDGPAWRADEGMGAGTCAVCSAEQQSCAPASAALHLPSARLTISWRRDQRHLLALVLPVDRLWGDCGEGAAAG